MGATLPGCTCSAACEGRGGGSATVESVNVLSGKAVPSAGKEDEGQGAEFPVYCLEMANFMMLEQMQKHEDVFEELVQPADDTMVHFISHEWLGFQHPDPDGTQLKRIQKVLSAFLAAQARSFFKERDWEAFLHGVSAGTGRSFRGYESQLAGRDVRSEADVAEHVRSGVVWLDYHSIPQTRKDEVFIKAVNGIPHYVERCDYFWVCAPPAMHKELQEPHNLQTWRSRGWCRLEDTINMLSKNLKMPLVVTNQPYVSTYGMFDGMQQYLGRTDRSVFNGNFTCCQLNHEIQQADGSIKRIDCDKRALVPVLRRSFHSYLAKPSGAERFKTNLFRCIGGTLFAGLPEEEKLWKPDPQESLEQALHRLGYASLADADELGWSPLMFLANLADFKLVLQAKEAQPELLRRTAFHGWSLLMVCGHLDKDRFAQLVDLNPEEDRMAAVNARSIAGHSPLDRVAKAGFYENVHVLLDRKADIEMRRNDNGATPLLSAAEARYPSSCQALLEHGADISAVDNAGFTALHLAVEPLALLGNPTPGATLEVIELLLEARASPNAKDKEGRTPLDLAQELCLEEKNGLELLRSFAHSAGS